jgi:hypothetical protein
MNESLFYKINQKSTIRKELLQYALSIKEWPRPKSFLGVLCPKEIYSKDPLLDKLTSIIRPGDASFYIFKIPAKTYYSIHTDGVRKAALNMLLNDHSNSVSFFKTSKFEFWQCSITELEYEQDSLYLFNTQNEHGVFNQGEDRFVISVQLDSSYQDALSFIKKNNL